MDDCCQRTLAAQILPLPIHLAERYSPLVCEGQGSIRGDYIGGFWILGLPKALGRYLPKKQAICAETPAMSHAYLQVAVKPALCATAVRVGVRLSSCMPGFYT